MNKKAVFAFCLGYLSFCICSLCVSAQTIYKSSPHNKSGGSREPEIYVSQAYETNRQVRELAIQKGLIPAITDGAFIEQAMQEGNSFILWLALGFDRKVELLNQYKIRLARAGVIIVGPGGYYADQINVFLLIKLENDAEVERLKKEGIESLFKSVACFEEDFYDVNEEMYALKRFLGEEVYDLYMQRFPQRRRYLGEVQSHAGQKEQ